MAHRRSHQALTFILQLTEFSDLADAHVCVGNDVGRSGVGTLLVGIGNPSVEAHATRLTSRMAQLVNGDAIYLPVSGVLATEAARDILAADEVAQQAIRLFDHVTTALVGIGSIEPSPLLAQSGNIFAPQELELLRQANAGGYL